MTSYCCSRRTASSRTAKSYWTDWIDFFKGSRRKVVASVHQGVGFSRDRVSWMADQGDQARFQGFHTLTLPLLPWPAHFPEKCTIGLHLCTPKLKWPTWMRLSQTWLGVQLLHTHLDLLGIVAIFLLFSLSSVLGTPIIALWFYLDWYFMEEI